MAIYKSLYRLGFLAYAFLLLYSILFYQERTAFVDMAYHLFFILKNGSLAIQNFRFAAIFTQLFPLLGSKLSLSLSTVAMLYSAGFIVFYFLCYYICGAVLKNYQMALVLLLFNILFVSDTYYWMQSELPQGAAIMLMVLSYITNRDIKDMHPVGIAIAMTGTVAFAFAHPMLLFPLAYTMIFFFLKNNANPSRKTIIIFSVFYLCCIASKIIFFRTPYDRGALSQGKNIIKLFPNYLTIHSNIQFISSCQYHYYWIPICFTGITLFYISKKAWFKMALFTGTSIFYILLINIILSDPGIPQFYIENMYLPLGIIIGLPLVFELVPSLGNKFAAFIFTSIIITAAIRIYISHAPYSKRLLWEVDFLKTHIDKKIIIDQELIPLDTLMMTWGTPYEFWILSTVYYNKSASIFITPKPDDFLPHSKPIDKELITEWGNLHYNSFPKTYFKFSDTTSPYILAKP